MKTTFATYESDSVTDREACVMLSNGSLLLLCGLESTDTCLRCFLADLADVR